MVFLLWYNIEIFPSFTFRKTNELSESRNWLEHSDTKQKKKKKVFFEPGDQVYFNSTALHHQLFFFLYFLFCLKGPFDAHDTLFRVKRKIAAFMQTHNFCCRSSRRFIVDLRTSQPSASWLWRVCVGSVHEEPSVGLRLNCIVRWSDIRGTRSRKPAGAWWCVWRSVSVSHPAVLTAVWKTAATLAVWFLIMRCCLNLEQFLVSCSAKRTTEQNHVCFFCYTKASYHDFGWRSVKAKHYIL